MSNALADGANRLLAVERRPIRYTGRLGCSKNSTSRPALAYETGTNSGDCYELHVCCFD